MRRAPAALLFSGKTGGKAVGVAGRTLDQTWNQINSYNVGFTHAHVPNLVCVVFPLSARADGRRRRLRLRDGTSAPQSRGNNRHAMEIAGLIIFARSILHGIVV